MKDLKLLLRKNRLKSSLAVSRVEFGLAANVPESFSAVMTKLDVIFSVKMETKQLSEMSVLVSNVTRPIAREHLVHVSYYYF
jgi:hypothetical protein